MTDYFLQEDAIIAILNADSLDVQALGEAMAELAKEPGGLTPDNFETRARNPRHPGHRHLEWDDAKCGVRWRHHQCRQLFRIVWTTEEHTDQPVRAFHSLRDDRPGGYRMISDILSSQDLTDSLLKQAEADLETFERKYRSLVEVVNLIAKAREKIAEKRRKLRRGPSGRPSAHP